LHLPKKQKEKKKEKKRKEKKRKGHLEFSNRVLETFTNQDIEV